MPGLSGLDKPVEYGIERSFGPLAILRARVPCGSQKPEQRAHEPQKALCKVHLILVARAYTFRLYSSSSAGPRRLPRGVDAIGVS